MPVSQYLEVSFLLMVDVVGNIQSSGISVSAVRKAFYFPFLSLQWNGSTTYEFAIERDFGTDYGICCWYTPQHNLTEVKLHQEQNNLSEPDWGFWFQDLPKVTSKLEMTNFPLKLALKLLKNFLMKMHPLV